MPRESERTTEDLTAEAGDSGELLPAADLVDDVEPYADATPVDEVVYGAPPE